MLTIVIIVLLIMMLAGSFPGWGYSAGWGYGPFGIILILLVVWLLFGNRLHM